MTFAYLRPLRTRERDVAFARACFIGPRRPPDAYLQARTIVFNRPRMKQIRIRQRVSGFLCTQRFEWPGWLDFAVPRELPSNTPPIPQRSRAKPLPSGYPNALNHKNRKGLSCKNEVDSIPSGKLKGRNAASSLTSRVLMFYWQAVCLRICVSHSENV